MLRRVVRELTIISVETAFLISLAATLGLSRAEFDRESDVAQAVGQSRGVERLGGGVMTATVQFEVAREYTVAGLGTK